MPSLWEGLKRHIPDSPGPLLIKQLGKKKAMSLRIIQLNVTLVFVNLLIDCSYMFSQVFPCQCSQTDTFKVQKVFEFG